MAPPVKKIVAKGSRCNNTAAIQNAINWMNQGRNNLKLDGIYGDNTESAVKTSSEHAGCSTTARWAALRAAACSRW